MTALKIHRCSLFKWSPESIESLAFEKDIKKLALSRAGKSVELWDLTFKPVIERVYHGQGAGSFQLTLWFQQRLFVAGYNGCVYELEYHSTTYKIGTEDGSILVASVDTDVKVEFYLTRSESRVLSLAWTLDGSRIVSGSDDCIRVWNAVDRKAVLRISVDRQQKNVSTIIWALAVIDDFVIVSGDSRGYTSFWNSKTGCLIDAYRSHQADVMAVCYDAEGRCVYSSGIDPSICQYVAVRKGSSHRYSDLRFANDSSMRFAESIRRNVHTHDVRALTMADKWLLSGGVDALLGMSCYPPKTVLRFPPFRKDVVSCSADSRCALFQYVDRLELWKLGSPEGISAKLCSDGEKLRLLKAPLKLLAITAKAEQTIVCSALSNSSRFLAYSNQHCTRVYRFECESGNEDGVSPSCTIQPLKNSNGDNDLAACSAICSLTADDGFVCAIGTEIVMVLVGECHFIVMNRFAISDDTVMIRRLQSSWSGSLVAALSSDYRVIIADVQQQQVLSQLPNYMALPVDLCFSSAQQDLLVLYSDGEVVEFSPSQKRYTAFYRKKLRKVIQRVNWNGSPTGIVASKHLPYLIWLYGFQQCHVIDRQKTEAVGGGPTTPWLRTVDRFGYLLALFVLSDSEMLTIESDRHKFETSLPPVLKKKRFGTG